MWEYMSSSSIGCASCMSGWERQGERRERQRERQAEGGRGGAGKLEKA